MADDYNAFDYYNAEPPREGATPPPEDFAASAPEDEFNEKVHGQDIVRRSSKTVRAAALTIAAGSLALSMVISSGGFLPNAGNLPTESSVPGTVTTESSIGTTAESTPAPTPTPSPTPTPVPKATEDLAVRLDSLQLYPLSKGYLAEVKFSLKTNCGTDVTSITGSLDSKLFRYDGYNAKKHKMKYHYENFHQEFSMDTSCIEKGEGAELTEKQYTLMFKVATDASSEDKFNVTLTISNTLNGDKTEDKTVTLKDIGIWNEKTDNYAASMYTISVKKNEDKSFDVTLTPKYEDVPISNPTIGGIYVMAKKGAAYFTNNDFKVTQDGNTFHIEFKKPKKAPSKGTISFSTFADFEVKDSTGTTFKDSAYGHLSKSY